MSSPAWSLLALGLWVPARCLNSCCAPGVAQLLTCKSPGSGAQGIRMSRKAGLGFLWSGGHKPRLQPLRVMLCSTRHLGCFSTLLLLLSAFGLQDCFLCCLSPLSGVDTGVTEAGGDRCGCCRVAHSSCGGKCAPPSVSCSSAISGAPDPPSSFTAPHFRGA